MSFLSGQTNVLSVISGCPYLAGVRRARLHCIRKDNILMVPLYNRKYKSVPRELLGQPNKILSSANLQRLASHPGARSNTVQAPDIRVWPENDPRTTTDPKTGMISRLNHSANDPWTGNGRLTIEDGNV